MSTDPSGASSSTMGEVAERILSLGLEHPVRVAVDGRTASGKTTFAEELAGTIRKAGRRVIRASVDGFHHPAVFRHRRGRLSADGYYEDARDLNAIRSLLLDPLGPGGNRCYTTQTFDLQNDQPIKPKVEVAADDAVLIVDGTFLQRPELSPAWDFVIFLNVPEDEARRRGIIRDRLSLGGEQATSELYCQRYGPAFSRYEFECKPVDRADAVIDNARWV